MTWNHVFDTASERFRKQMARKWAESTAEDLSRAEAGSALEKEILYESFCRAFAEFEPELQAKLDYTMKEWAKALNVTLPKGALAGGKG